MPQRGRDFEIVAFCVLAILLAITGCAQKQDEAPKEVKKSAAPKSTTAKAPSKAQSQASTPAAKTQASEPNVTQASEKPMYLGEVLAAWNTGKKGEAVNKFLQLNWQDPSVFQGVPGLSMSEQDFASLSQVQRDQMSQRVQALSQNLRDIAKAVVASTDSFIASGNSVGAKARLDSVQQFGQALATPEHLQIIQLVGKAISGLAQEKLSAVK
jgi:hypothetical protein